MAGNPLESLDGYSQFMAQLLDRTTVERSTDDFPHPKDPGLAPTFPHHKHVPPDIKHNRIPAPEMSFTRPNLPTLIREIEELADT